MDINKGSYRYSMVLDGIDLNAVLYMSADNLVDCVEEIFNSDFFEPEDVESVTIENDQ